MHSTRSSPAPFVPHAEDNVKLQSCSTEPPTTAVSRSWEIIFFSLNKVNTWIMVYMNRNLENCYTIVYMRFVNRAALELN